MGLNEQIKAAEVEIAKLKKELKLRPSERRTPKEITTEIGCLRRGIESGKSWLAATGESVDN